MKLITLVLVFIIACAVDHDDAITADAGMPDAVAPDLEPVVIEPPPIIFAACVDVCPTEQWFHTYRHLGPQHDYQFSYCLPSYRQCDVRACPVAAIDPVDGHCTVTP